MLAVENRESCPDTTGRRPRCSQREDLAGAFLPGTFVAAFVGSFVDFRGLALSHPMRAA
jgi:hypothetical protein